MAWAVACTLRSTIHCSKGQAEVDRQDMTHQRRPARGGILWDLAAQGRGSAADGLAVVVVVVLEVAVLEEVEIPLVET